MESCNEMIDRLRLKLESKLPGQESQFKMAPRIRLENKHDYYRNAAVMILLYQKEGEWYFVLMKRPEYKGAHSNQVSLPGGINELEDPDLEATALRETKEELGIDVSDIEVVGGLTKLHIPVSGIEVSPFIGIYPQVPVFVPDPAEVSYLIEVPLTSLFSPENIKDDIRNILDKPVRVPYFHLEGEQVWGATGMILSEFLDLIREL